MKFFLTIIGAALLTLHAAAGGFIGISASDEANAIPADAAHADSVDNAIGTNVVLQGGFNGVFTGDGRGLNIVTLVTNSWYSLNINSDVGNFYFGQTMSQTSPDSIYTGQIGCTMYQVNGWWVMAQSGTPYYTNTTQQPNPPTLGVWFACDSGFNPAPNYYAFQFTQLGTVVSNATPAILGAMPAGASIPASQVTGLGNLSGSNRVDFSLIDNSPTIPSTNTVAQTNDARPVTFLNTKNAFAGTFTPTTNSVSIGWGRIEGAIGFQAPTTMPMSSTYGFLIPTNQNSTEWFFLSPDEMGSHTNVVITFTYYATNSGTKWAMNLGANGGSTTGGGQGGPVWNFMTNNWSIGFNTAVTTYSFNPTWTNSSLWFMWQQGVNFTNNMWLVHINAKIW